MSIWLGVMGSYAGDYRKTVEEVLTDLAQGDRGWACPIACHKERFYWPCNVHEPESAAGNSYIQRDTETYTIPNMEATTVAGTFMNLRFSPPE